LREKRISLSKRDLQPNVFAHSIAANLSITPPHEQLFALNQLSVVSFEVNTSVSKMPLTRNSGRKRKSRQLSFSSNNQDSGRTPELDDSFILSSEDSQDIGEDSYFDECEGY